MSSVPNPEQKPHDVPMAALLADFEEALKLARDAPRPSDQKERLAVLDRSSSGRPWLWGFIGLLLAAGLFGAAFASRSSYGEAAKAVIARWAPQLIPTSPQPQEPSEPVAQSNPPAAVEAVPPQPGPPAQTTPPDFAPAPAQVSPELARLLQTIAHDIANLDQGIEQFKMSQEQVARDNAKAIEQLRASVEQLASNNADATEQLKASQEQMARDNAKAIEQVKANQEQISHLLAKASEPKLQPKPSVPASNRTASASKPVPVLRPPQTRAQPQSTRPQLQ